MSLHAIMVEHAPHQVIVLAPGIGKAFDANKVNLKNYCVLTQNL